MNSPKLQTALYSTAGVVVMFVAIVGLNLAFSPARVRLDLTEDRLHTLSDGTRKILDRLKDSDTDVVVNYYVSQKGNRLPTQMETYARQVEDMLSEYRAQSGGRLVVKKFDPQPDSEVEDAAKLDGVEAQVNPQNGEPFYLGLSVALEPQKVTLPSLTPDRDRLLEYDLSRAISQVLQTAKPVIGVMSPLPVFGQQANPMMARMGQQGSEPWLFLNELKRDFDVQEIPMDSATIDEKVQVLLLIHPKDITDTAEYAIDQFILRGGRLVALLDALSLADNRNPNPMGFNMGGGSTLPQLLKSWGLEFDTTRVVADLQFTKEVNFGRGPQMAPAFLFVNQKGINADDALFSQTDNLLLPFAGAFTGKPADGLTQEVLVRTTTDSQLVDGVTAQLNGRKIVDDFTASGSEYALAVRLSGRFKTAFPGGRPGAAAAGETNAPTAQGLTESAGEGTVYLIGDSDFLYDPYCVQIDRMFRVAIPFNGNLALGQNLMEQLAGDSNLIGARSRASLRRPFTVVQEKEAEAQKRFQAEIARFQKEVEEAQQRISEIQSRKEGSQKFILSPEAAAELKKLQERQVVANKELRRVRKELRQEVESMQDRWKWINIALMPVVVSGAGIGLALARRRRTAAR